MDCNTHPLFLCECDLFGVLLERERSCVLRTVTVSKCLFEAGLPVAPEPGSKALPFSRDSRPAQLSGVTSSRRWGRSLLSEGQGMA